MLAVLEIFGVKDFAIRLLCGCDYKAVVPTQAIPIAEMDCITEQWNRRMHCEKRTKDRRKDLLCFLGAHLYCGFY